VLILAGALGNLYDNLFLAAPGAAHPFGLVRDFIDVYFRAFDWHFDTFNVADACICVGAAILLLQGLFARRAKAPPEGYS
jgi:signal peptidase II